MKSKIKYEVEFCTSMKYATDRDEPRYTHEQRVFTKLDEARKFAFDNAGRDIFGEVHIRRFIEDIYGIEYLDDEAEIITR